MSILGIEGGGTRTSVLLVNSADDTVLKTLPAGPGNLRLLSGEALASLLAQIRDQLPVAPDRIGIGFAGVRSEADRERLTRAVARCWPGVLAEVTDDLILALEAAEWRGDCAAAGAPAQRHRLVLPRPSSRWPHGESRRARPHHRRPRQLVRPRHAHAALVMAIADHLGVWPPLGADILAFLQMNDPESLIEWSMSASKSELASIAQVVFEAAATRQDEIAVPILRRMAYRLSKDAVQCAVRVARTGEKVQFVLNGSVLLKNPEFADGVIERIRAGWPQSHLAPLHRPSVWGGIEMGAQTD